MSNEQGSEGVGGQQREVEDRFIACWGEISALWGVNRTIGRMHALLFLAPEPLDAATIAARLEISHGNCSTSLNALLGWGVIRRIHRPGQRKAFYEAEQDPWTWFHTCIRERRRREIDPVLASLEDVRALAESSAKDPDAPPSLVATHERVDAFVTFMDDFVALIDAFLAVGHGRMGRALTSVVKKLPRRGGTRHDGSST